MRVLVCGGRDYQNLNELFYHMDFVHAVSPISLIIHGKAQGADTLAGRWATSRSIPIKEFPADWSNLDKAAGPIRNAQMIREGKPELVIAFKGGPGTADMIRKAIIANIRTVLV